MSSDFLTEAYREVRSRRRSLWPSPREGELTSRPGLVDYDEWRIEPEPEDMHMPMPLGSLDAGARATVPPPPPGMNEMLRASLRAHRREPLPEDYLDV